MWRTVHMDPSHATLLWPLPELMWLTPVPDLARALIQHARLSAARGRDVEQQAASQAESGPHHDPRMRQAMLRRLRMPLSTSPHAAGMIAGGTGITPMYQVAAAILKDPTDRTQVGLQLPYPILMLLRLRQPLVRQRRAPEEQYCDGSATPHAPAPSQAHRGACRAATQHCGRVTHAACARAR